MQPESSLHPVPRRRARIRLSAFGPLLGLAALVALATALNPAFLTIANIFNVLTRTSFIGIIAVGGTFVIIAGGIDLSVGSMAALLAGSMILVMNALAPTLGGGWLTIVVGMLFVVALGALFGLGHGLAITKGRIEPFIVTLGTLGIFRSVLTYLSEGGAITLQLGLSNVYSHVYYGSFLRVPIPLWVFLAMAILGAVLLNRTAFGRHVQAIGSNEQVARYAALRVDREKIVTYMIQGVCVAVATILYVPRLGSASPSTGLLWELEAIAAVIIGGTALKGGSGSVPGTVVGAILLSTIGNVLNLTSIISVYLNAAVQGVVIILVAFLQRGREAR
ncbi:MAG TPA: ABC transporter permease [Trueperaceae bacterium]|nr:ABC transporter permease [Trueperaceae bacterium]